jgi:copper chaperone
MNSKETVLAVSGMSCGSCVRHVHEALDGLNGITKVDVRLREGKVVVLHDPEVAPVGALVEALGEAGYESEPTPAARANPASRSCCCG